jgi:LacI family transcriptional regulator
VSVPHPSRDVDVVVPPKNRVTIQDVAVYAGVSRAAVSKVLRQAPGVSAEMKRRVDAAIVALQYRPQMAARSLRGRSRTLGVLQAGPADPIVESLVPNLEATRYDFLVRPVTVAPDTQFEAARSLIDRGMEGLVLVGSSLTEEQLTILAQHVPVVLVGRGSRSDLFDSFAVDEAAVGRLQFDHLAALGHRRIAFLAERGSDRADAFHDRATRRGLAATTSAHAAALSEEGGYRAARELLVLPQPPTAVVAFTDAVALGVLRAAHDLGVCVPDRLSVVGCGDMPIASHPLIGLTSVSVNDVGSGGDVVKTLLDRVAGRTTAAHVRWRPRLFARRSSAAPPA